MQSSACAGGPHHSPPLDTEANETQTSHQGIFVGFGNGSTGIAWVNAQFLDHAFLASGATGIGGAGFHECLMCDESIAGAGPGLVCGGGTHLRLPLLNVD